MTGTAPSWPDDPQRWRRSAHEIRLRRIVRMTKSLQVALCQDVGDPVPTRLATSSLIRLRADSADR